MKAKTIFAVAAFSVVAAMAGAAFAAPAVAAAPEFPCQAQMAGMYAQLAGTLNLTGPAKDAFDKYVQARARIAAKHYEQMRGNFKRPDSADEALALRSERLKARAAMLDEIAAARATLEKSLTPEQKEALDAYEPRFGMGAGMGHRHHRGYGMGPGCGYGQGMGAGMGPGCVYGMGPSGDGWGWHGPRHGYGMGPGYGYGPGCRW